MMNTIQFDKKLTCGSDFVAVEVLDTCEELKIGNIWLPDTARSNERLAHCRITDIGTNAKEKTGAEVGDYIMIDRLATFAWTSPTAALKYDSVICKTNADKSEFWPNTDSMFVEPDQKDNITEVNGIAVVNYEKRLNTGVIIKTNFEKTTDYPFEPGQRVMLVKGGDVIQLSETTLHIFKKDMIVCVIEDK